LHVSFDNIHYKYSKIAFSKYRTTTKTIKKRGEEEKTVTLVNIKGIKDILKERGIWKEFKRRNGVDPALNCKGEAQTLLNGQINEYCCASHRLAREPDFKNQKPGLEEAVLNSGHLFDNYPKFHCETNWIERYWKGSKDNARKNCDYTFASLKKNLNKYMDEVPLIHVGA
jgi:hypothetical protein